MFYHFENYATSIAVIDKEGKSYTYKWLIEEGEKLASKVAFRSLVFCLCSNTVGCLLGYTAFLNHNIVSLMLDEKIPRNLLENLIEVYKPDFIYKPASNEYNNNCNSGNNGNGCSYFNYGYVLEKTKYEKAFSLHSDLALLLTTSGSTGSPKFVRQSYQNIKANTQSIVEYLSITSKERAITTLPMNYTYGLSIINTHLAVGATLILTQESIMQKSFWRLFKEQRATSFGGVPYTYEMLKKLHFEKMDLPSLETMTQAGGKLSVELHKFFAQYAKDNGKHFVVMYGQTEATARMSYLAPQHVLNKVGSIGVAIPGGRFSLVGIDGNEIREAETVGELIYYGANVTLGYAQKGEDLEKGDENFGKLATGDMAKVDKDGFYYIVGRKKRFLKIFGNRVNLDEVERLIKVNFSILDIASTGLDDKLIVYITSEKEIEAVRTFLQEKTSINRVAINVRYIEKIPRNEAGKILYKELSVL